jgi:hypothetical protein
LRRAKLNVSSAGTLTSAKVMSGIHLAGNETLSASPLGRFIETAPSLRRIAGKDLSAIERHCWSPLIHDIGSLDQLPGMIKLRVAESLATLDLFGKASLSIR